MPRCAAHAPLLLADQHRQRLQEASRHISMTAANWLCVIHSNGMPVGNLHDGEDVAGRDVCFDRTDSAFRLETPARPATKRSRERRAASARPVSRACSETAKMRNRTLEITC